MTSVPTKSSSPKTGALAARHLVMDFIAETAWAAGVQTGLIQEFAAIGDEAGMRYAARGLAANVKAITSVIKDMAKAGEGAQ